jgi:hypothetical protein
MSAYIQPGRAPDQPGPPRHTVRDLEALQAAIRADLKRRILHFCRQRGIKPTTFGRHSVRDTRLVDRLSDHRTVMGYPILRQVERYLEDNEYSVPGTGRR